MRNWNDNGFVYYILDKSHQIIKIGKTNISVNKRCRDIQDHLDFFHNAGILHEKPKLQIETFEVVEDSKKHEMELHIIFGHIRAGFLDQTIKEEYRHVKNIIGKIWGNEWFDFNEEIKEHIEEIKNDSKKRSRP